MIRVIRVIRVIMVIRGIRVCVIRVLRVIRAKGGVSTKARALNPERSTRNPCETRSPGRARCFQAGL